LSVSIVVIEIDESFGDDAHASSGSPRRGLPPENATVTSFALAGTANSITATPVIAIAVAPLTRNDNLRDMRPLHAR
jgi:hypothetical protein